MAPEQTAAELQAAIADIEAQKSAYIEILRQRIIDAQAELVALGAKRVRKPRAEQKKVGRPKGSRNRNTAVTPIMRDVVNSISPEVA